MKKQINIAEILKDKPKGTKLYSPMCGECHLDYIDNSLITLEELEDKAYSSPLYFYADGSYMYHGECLLFPSKIMCDWNKFSWKKGDVLELINIEQKENKIQKCFCMFGDFMNDKYTTFYSLYWFNGETFEKDRNGALGTNNWQKASEANTKKFINTIEERLGGKLNLETLEVEKQGFKDGDFIIMNAKYHDTYILITKGWKAQPWRYYCFCNNSDWIGTVESDLPIIASNIQYRKATEEEKKHLIDNLYMAGKYWNADTKQIEDIKPKWTPKPFDKVITRVDDDAVWTANIFSHIDSHGEYVTIGCESGYCYCIPYNEETAKLIGTNEDYKEV